MHSPSCSCFQEKFIQKNETYYVLSNLKEWLGNIIFDIVLKYYIPPKELDLFLQCLSYMVFNGL